MTTRVELLSDHDCPNAEAARTALREAFQSRKLAAEWSEASARGRGYGSPTVLVDGRDVAGALPSDAPACRVYSHAGGRFSGAPPVELIAAALDNPMGRFGWGGLVAALPGFGAALLPVLGCPACWPAYAATVTALGVGFLLEQTYLLPLTALFLGLALIGFARGARSRHGYAPLATGGAGAAITLVGKFAFESDPLWFSGLGIFAAAAVWNAWPRGRRSAGSCASCATHEPAADESAHKWEVT